MSRKQRAVVIFPGRGSYGASELGYLKRRHGARAAYLSTMDAVVAEAGGTPAGELDAAEAFAPRVHLPGRNASNLIYACALADFAAIDRDRFEIVAVCGNSLGWYLTLAAGGAVDLADGARIVDDMGRRMETRGVGGQILYPLTDDEWRIDPQKLATVDAALEEANRAGRAFRSIDLGGTAVLAGDDAGVAALLKALPGIDDRFPMKLPRHAAFHTPLLTHVSEEALAAFSTSMFSRPSTAMIDGRGVIWSPAATDEGALHRYTFGHQIVEPYDFTASVRVALREFAPDRVILTGPGGSMGPPVAQTLIRERWDGLASRADFLQRQKSEPLVLSMDRDQQRALATGG